MNSCPSIALLEQLLDGALDGEERLAVERHVDECLACQEVLQQRLEAEGAEFLPPPHSAIPTEVLDRLCAQTPAPATSLGTIADEGLPPAPPGYELQGLLGRGGMAVVYLARQLSLGRLVALKFLRQGPLAEDHERIRFRQEAQAVAQLHHPNIVQIHEVGECKGVPYLVLEYVQGGSLAQALRDRPLTAREAVDLVRTLAETLHFAHQSGIVHRDLKPANVLLQGSFRAEKTRKDDPAFPPISLPEPSGLSSGNTPIPKITDFGIAKLLENTREATVSGVFLGTPSYCAPEQADGTSRAIGPSADVYGLGALLYECLTGRPPFLAATTLETLRQVLAQDPVPPRRLVPELARDVDIICLKCLEKDPHRRYGSAADLAADLERFLRGEPIVARAAGIWDRGRKWVVRKPATAALVAVIAVAAIGFFAGAWVHTVDLREASATAETRRREAEVNLYHSLLGEARALRLAGESGYRDRVWDRLQRARALDVADRDLVELRDEAVACMGDFVGLEPIIRANPGLSRVRGQRLVLHPDGRELILGLGDGTVLVQDVASGAERSRLTGEHHSEISSIALTSDGTRLVSADVEGRVRVWEKTPRDSWTCAARFEAGPRVPAHVFGGITAAAPSPDGRWLAACSTGAKEILIWDMVEGQTAASFKGPAGEQFRVLAWSPEGRYLAAGHNSPHGKGLIVWNTATRQVLYERPLEVGVLFTLAFSPDGNLLVIGGNQGVALFDVDGMRPRPALRGEQVQSVSFSPDGRLLCFTSEAVGVVRLWDLNSNRPEVTLQLPGGPFALAMSCDGHTLVAASPTSIHFWQLPNTPEKIVPRGHSRGVPHVIFHPNGQHLASAAKDRTVRIWDSTTGKLVRELGPFAGDVESLAYDEANGHLATADLAGDLKIWDADRGVEVSHPRHDVGLLWSVAMSPDGRYLAAAGVAGVGLGVRQGAIRLERVRGSPNSSATFVTFSPDSQRLAFVCPGQADGEHSIYLCDLADGRVRQLPARLHFFVRALAFLPDSRHLVFVGSRKTIEIWNVIDAQQVVEFGDRDHASGYGGVALSRDGAWFACGEQAVTIWDVPNRRRSLRLRRERSTVWSCAFGPGGEQLAVGSSDGGPVIWDVGKIRAQLTTLGLGE